MKCFERKLTKVDSTIHSLSHSVPAFFIQHHRYNVAAVTMQKIIPSDIFPFLLLLCGKASRGGPLTRHMFRLLQKKSGRKKTSLSYLVQSSNVKALLGV